MKLVFTSFLVLFYHLVCIAAFIYVKTKDVSLRYLISSFDQCFLGNDRISFFQESTITECVIECGLRSHCEALNFIERMKLCELFSSEDVALAHEQTGQCIYVKKPNIFDIQIPCRGCLFGESCDRYSKICQRKECLHRTKLENGRVLGNLRGIGNVARYKCYEGFKERNGITTATCLANGTWSRTPECIRVCKEPVIQNAFISNGGTLEGDDRKVTCLNGTTIDLNKTVSSIRCAEDGSWIPVDMTCSKFNRVVFRVLAGTGKGAAEAWMDGTGTTSDITCRNPMNCNCTAHYRDPRINDWNSLNVQKVRYSIYKDGKEVVWVMFNGTGSNMMNWFQSSRIIDSSYSDLSPTPTFNYFSIDNHDMRTFYVSVSHGGCDGDTFYFVTIDQTDSCWDGPFPKITYSKIGTMANTVNSDNFGYADTVTIALSD